MSATNEKVAFVAVDSLHTLTFWPENIICPSYISEIFFDFSLELSNDVKISNFDLRAHQQDSSWLPRRRGFVLLPFLTCNQPLVTCDVSLLSPSWVINEKKGKFHAVWLCKVKRYNCITIYSILLTIYIAACCLRIYLTSTICHL